MSHEVIIVGDVHRDFAALNQLINKKRPALTLACGDFGYWPKFESSVSPKPGDGQVYFCDGNHDDHASLRALTDNQVWPGVYYMARGSHMTLPDGRTVMFIGGASSIDQAWRTEGVDWFREEVITEQEAFDFPDVEVDIMISHTCPRAWIKEVYPGSIDMHDPSTLALTLALQKYRPKEWYFGHWHVEKRGVHTFRDDGSTCAWTALSHTRGVGRWWCELNLTNEEVGTC